MALKAGTVISVKKCVNIGRVNGDIYVYYVCV